MQVNNVSIIVSYLHVNIFCHRICHAYSDSVILSNVYVQCAVTACWEATGCTTGSKVTAFYYI